jgi:translation initiation factor 2D
MPGSSAKNPQQEIMVQGPQTKNVTELLLSQGVPKKYIEVVDKTGKGKKK